jgi:hypothetical protein
MAPGSTWREGAHKVRYPIRLAVGATNGRTRSMRARFACSFHLSSRIGEKAL